MWYVVWAVSRNEESLHQRMREILPESLYRTLWLPLWEEQRKEGKEWRSVIRPMFPGYFFIDADDPERLDRALLREKHYIGLLKSGDDYVPLTEEEEALIRRLLGNREVAGMSTGIIHDGVLQILDGPLREMQQYIVHINRHKRKAYLKMMLFGEMRDFSMGLEIVERI